MTFKEKTVFNFYGSCISLEGSLRIIDKIRKDFSYFISESNKNCDFFIVVNTMTPEFPDFTKLKKLISLNNTYKRYRKDDKIIINYQEKAKAELDKKNSLLTFTSDDEDLLHELVYLAVHSVSAELMEKKNIYRMHGMAILNNSQSVAMIADSGTGKTALLLDLISGSDLKYFSDDVVLLDNDFNLLPFPVRIGVSESDLSLLKRFSDEKSIYTINRRKYGIKYLLSAEVLTERIAEKTRLDYLAILTRKSNFEKKGFECFKGLKIICKNFIIGLGLPHLFEYMELSVSFKGFIGFAGKVIKRSFFFLKMLFSVKKISIRIGTDRSDNVKKLMDMFDE